MLTSFLFRIATVFHVEAEGIRYYRDMLLPFFQLSVEGVRTCKVVNLNNCKTSKL